MDTNVITRLPTLTRTTMSSAANVRGPETTPAGAVSDTENGSRPQETEGSSATENAEQLRKLVEDINTHQQSIKRSLYFSIDRDNGQTVITVVDKETKEVIRQIPPEVALKIADALQDSAGLLLSEEA